MEIPEEKHLGITQIKSTKFSYKWMIHNYDSNDKQTGEYILSPSFSCHKKKDIKWHIALYPKGEKETHKDYMSIYLRLIKAVNPKMRTKVSMSIVDCEGKECQTREGEHTYEQNNGYGWKNFLKIDYLYSHRNFLMPNNTLTIICHVRIDTQIVHVTDNHNTKYSEYQISLQNELENLFKNKLLTDVTFDVNEKELEAHKVILAAKSPVFLAMFQNEMKEKENCRIEITDFEPDIINEMLLYFYTGRVENMDKHCYDLVRLADKYEVQSLKLLCEEYFCNKLCKDNAIEMLIAADCHNCEKLKPQIMKFIVANAKDVVKTPQFQTLKKDLPPLVMEMILAMT